MAGVDDAEVNFDAVVDRVYDEQEWTHCMGPMNEGPRRECSRNCMMRQPNAVM